MKNQVRYLQNLFYDLLNDYGRVYIAIKYSDKTVIGSRGFTDEEKEKGLILVFNRRNHKNIKWTKDGSIVVTLGFDSGNKPENCFLHSDDIVAVYSPDAMVRFDRLDMLDIKGAQKEPEAHEDMKSTDRKVISLMNFKKQKTAGTERRKE